MAKLSKRNKTILIIAIVVTIVAAAAAGLWYWNKQKKEAAKKEEEKAEIEAETIVEEIKSRPGAEERMAAPKTEQIKTAVK